MPERLAVLMAFRRQSNRLHFELWTTPVADQLRSYVDGGETYSRIVRDGEGSMSQEVAELRAAALAAGWMEELLSPV